MLLGEAPEVFSTETGTLMRSCMQTVLRTKRSPGATTSVSRWSPTTFGFSSTPLTLRTATRAFGRLSFPSFQSFRLSRRRSAICSSCGFEGMGTDRLQRLAEAGKLGGDAGVGKNHAGGRSGGGDGRRIDCHRAVLDGVSCAVAGVGGGQDGADCGQLGGRGGCGRGGAVLGQE